MNYLLKLALKLSSFFKKHYSKTNIQLYSGTHMNTCIIRKAYHTYRFSFFFITFIPFSEASKKSAGTKFNGHLSFEGRSF